MKRLFWKELREKRLWGLIFFGFITIIPAITHNGSCFGGHIYTTSPLIFLLLIPGLLMGLNTFSREMAYECQDFLFSRPIAWKRIVAVKILSDFMVMLSGIVLAAIVYRLMMIPSEYAQFVGIRELALGIGIAFFVSVIGYLPGLGGSVVLPGIMGGGMVLFLIAVALGTEIALLTGFGGHNNERILPAIISWLVALIVASVILAKRGLGLSAKERAMRYILYVSVISTLMLLWTIPVTARRWSTAINRSFARSLSVFLPEMVFTEISPDKNMILSAHLLIEFQNGKLEVEKLSLTRKSDETTAEMPLDVSMIESLANNSWENHGWTAPDTLILYPHKWQSNAPLTFFKIRMDKSGNIIEQKSPSFEIRESEMIYMNPNESYASFPGVGSSAKYTCLHIMDLKTMQPLNITDNPEAKDVSVVFSPWKTDSALEFSLSMQKAPYSSKRYRLRITPDGKAVAEAAASMTESSPDGRFKLFAHGNLDTDEVDWMSLTRKSDGKTARINATVTRIKELTADFPRTHIWYAPDTLAFFDCTTWPTVKVEKVRMDGAGHLIEENSPSFVTWGEFRFSPKGRYAALYGNNVGPKNEYLQVIDLRTMRPITIANKPKIMNPQINGKKKDWVWLHWKSESELVFIIGPGEGKEALRNKQFRLRITPNGTATLDETTKLLRPGTDQWN